MLLFLEESVTERW